MMIRYLLLLCLLAGTVHAQAEARLSIALIPVYILGGTSAYAADDEVYARSMGLHGRERTGHACHGSPGAQVARSAP